MKKELHGWVVLNKPEGSTSMAATTKVRRLLEVNRAGHAGTLDPFATGVLPIALGEATKTMRFVLKQRKVYEFVVEWGRTTQTGDPHGHTVAQCAQRPTRLEIEGALPFFQGSILQTPPCFSAIKVGGVRAYARARAGQEVRLNPRRVQIEKLFLKEIPTPHTAHFHVICGAGTYIRALGQDLAHYLGTCGHVIALQRLQVGPFQAKDAISLDYLQQMRHDPAKFLRPLEDMLDDIPALPLGVQEARKLHQGQTLVTKSADAPVVLCTLHGSAVALARCEKGFLAPFCVFNFSRKESGS